MGEKKAYQKIKTLTRGKVVDKEKYVDIISALGVSDEDRAALVNLSPATYPVERLKKSSKNIKHVRNSWYIS